MICAYVNQLLSLIDLFLFVDISLPFAGCVGVGVIVVVASSVVAPMNKTTTELHEVKINFAHATGGGASMQM